MQVYFVNNSGTIENNHVEDEQVSSLRRVDEKNPRQPDESYYVLLNREESTFECLFLVRSADDCYRMQAFAADINAKQEWKAGHIRRIEIILA